MRHKIHTVVLIAATLMLLGGCQPPTAADFEKQNAQGSIDMCWEDQGKKSLDPSTARFLAGICEKMDADYAKKYGRSYRSR